MAGGAGHSPPRQRSPVFGAPRGNHPCGAVMATSNVSARTMNSHCKLGRAATTFTLVALAALLNGCAQSTKPIAKPLNTASMSAEASADPYLWLEDVTGTNALDWVRKQNAVSTKELEASPGFAPLRQKLLAILDSKERIPFVSKHGKFYYNFRRDQKNVRGLLPQFLKDVKLRASAGYEMSVRRTLLKLWQQLFRITDVPLLSGESSLTVRVLFKPWLILMDTFHRC